jgi:hypothetical protein
VWDNLTHEEFFLSGCIGEDQQLFAKNVKNPIKRAKDLWKKQGWLIKKDGTTYCPACAAKLKKESKNEKK